jgi:hypothetical protein
MQVIDMTETKFKLSEMSSYLANGFAAVFGGVTRDDLIFYLALVAGFGTFVVNSWFAWRRDRREERALDAGLQKRAGP